MKLELKKVNVVTRMSEETTCFNAVLYLNGKPAADCSNSGHGGMTVVRFYNTEVQQNITKYCKENPVVNEFRGKTMVFHNVDVRVDELLIEHQMKTKLKSKQKKSLVLHNNKLKDPKYIIHSYLNLQNKVADMMGTNFGQKFLRTQIEAFRNKGYTIMNTNIDYKLLGLQNP